LLARLGSRYRRLRGLLPGAAGGIGLGLDHHLEFLAAEEPGDAAGSDLVYCRYCGVRPVLTSHLIQ
jgi:hypothetical protein